MGNNLINREQFNGLDEFIAFLDADYREKIKMNSLFNTTKTKHWSSDQRAFFCKVFYHLRGHFHDFLWLMGNFAPSLEVKNIFLKNIGEEFGGTRRSHELLYFDFANALNVDIPKEIISEEHYLEFARAFNREHIRWLLEHSWNEKFSAFAAYERLDNVDYPQLLELANSFSLSKDALLFFKVHTKVEHYDAAEGLLKTIWDTEPQSVISGFTFIYGHQITMWQQLVKAVESLEREQFKIIEEMELLTV